MTGLTSAEIFGVLIVVVLSVVLAAVGLLLRQRLQRRRDQLRGELSHRPQAVSDRAFNRIAMARREADLLAGQGTEVPRARELIGEAQAGFDTRQFDSAYQLAQSAHETLVAARRRPPIPGSARPVPTGLLPRDPPLSAGTPPPSVAEASPVARIPAHRAESQFQIRLLKDDLDRVAKDPGTSGPAARASALYTRAQAAFDREEYSEAFRLALKGRREAGSPVETLAPPARGKGAPGPESPGSPDRSSNDPELAAAALASADRCPSCGHPTSSEDVFCRGCGTPRAGAACGQCGAGRTPDDVFCGKCGASFAPAGTA